MPSIAIVIVTFNSAKSIVRLLNNLFEQTLSAEHICVVDNHSQDDTVSLVKSLNHSSIHLIELGTNQGGAGGFARGFAEAIHFKPDVIFSFDDDAFPADPNFIKNMVKAKQQFQLDVVSPLVVNPDNHAKSAYSYRSDNQLCSTVSKIQQHPIIRGDIKLFNGVLFDSQVIRQLKGPRPEFFIRGDEQEFKTRILLAHYQVGVYTPCIVYHPTSLDEYVEVNGKRFQHIESRFKFFFSTRNQAYMLKIRQDFSIRKRTVMLFKEFYHYTWFYLVYRKGDIANYCLWLKAFIFGILGYMNNDIRNKL